MATTATRENPELGPARKHLVEAQTLVPNTRGWGRSRRPCVTTSTPVRHHPLLFGPQHETPKQPQLEVESLGQLQLRPLENSVGEVEAVNLNEHALPRLLRLFTGADC